jgi:hypothetical protein
MILTRESRSTRRKACIIDTFSTTNPTRDGLELNTVPLIEVPEKTHLSHGTILTLDKIET